MQRKRIRNKCNTYDHMTEMPSRVTVIVSYIQHPMHHQTLNDIVCDEVRIFSRFNYIIQIHLPLILIIIHKHVMIVFESYGNIE